MPLVQDKFGRILTFRISARVTSLRNMQDTPNLPHADLCRDIQMTRTTSGYAFRAWAMPDKEIQDTDDPEFLHAMVSSHVRMKSNHALTDIRVEPIWEIT